VNNCPAPHSLFFFCAPSFRDRTQPSSLPLFTYSLLFLLFTNPAKGSLHLFFPFRRRRGGHVSFRFPPFSSDVLKLSNRFFSPALPDRKKASSGPFFFFFFFVHLFPPLLGLEAHHEHTFSSFSLGKLGLNCRLPLPHSSPAQSASSLPRQWKMNQRCFRPVPPF